LTVGLEPDHRALGRALRERRRFPAEVLDRLLRVERLGRVDADQSDALLTPGDRDDKRIAVDDANDRGLSGPSWPSTSSKGASAADQDSSTETRRALSLQPVASIRHTFPDADSTSKRTAEIGGARPCSLLSSISTEITKVGPAARSGSRTWVSADGASAPGATGISGRAPEQSISPIRAAASHDFIDVPTQLSQGVSFLGAALEIP